MTIGKLVVKVYAKNQGEPLENTNIQILNPTTQDTIYELITNSSGQSDTINLDAPNEGYSQEPQSPKPYQEFDILAKKDGFDSVKIEGVQIFPDSLSIQNIYLNYQNVSERIYNIPEHNLYATYPPKIAEDPIKKISTSSGLAVLPKPVIPEYVIVHDGVPEDNSAPNYWIPYKNYIKNVCSSEIYPTWPYESIIANILVINSFTLNRVYTEWYKNLGYNFTITSSTAR